MKYRLALAFMAFTALAPFTYAAPSISIGAFYEYVEPHKSTLLKRIRNSGDSTAFVKVKVSEISFDSGEAIELPTASLAKKDEKQSHTLIASPARLIIPAGGMQATRLLFMGDRQKERYFRVRFSPVLPAQKDDFGIADGDADQYKASLSAGVNVLTGYGSIVVVRPTATHYQTQLQDGKDEYTVQNNGNSIIVLDAVYDCQDQGKQCTTPTKHHVRPQRSHVFKKEAGHHYRFNLIEGSHKKEVEFK